MALFSWTVHATNKLSFCNSLQDTNHQRCEAPQVLQEIEVARDVIIAWTYVITVVSFRFMCKRTGLDSGTPECHDHCKLLVVGTSLHTVCCFRLLTKTVSCKLAIQRVYQCSMSSQTTVQRKVIGSCNKNIKDQMNPLQVEEQHSCWVCWDAGIKLIWFAGFVITGSSFLIKF